MLHKTWAVGFALVLAAAPLSAALAAGGGADVAGGVNDKGPDGSSSPRSTLGTKATAGSHMTHKTASKKPAGDTTGAGHSGSANAQKTSDGTSQ